MTKRSIFILIIFCGLAMLQIQCGKKDKAKDVYYQVGKGEVTKDEVDRVWMNLPEEMKYQYMGRKGRQDMLSNLVNLELLYQEALRQKLDQDPVIKFNVDRTVKNMLAQEVIERSVNPEELLLFFQENFMRLDGLSFKSRDPADTAYQALVNGADFEALKEKMNLQAQGRDLGYLNRDGFIAQFGADPADQVFGMGKDQKFTKPVETAKGWYIFYALEKPGNLNNQGYKSVEEQILNLKKEEIYRGVINELRSQIAVTPDQKNIDEFLKIGADWEKAQLAPQQGATALPPAPEVPSGGSVPSAGATPEPLPGATIK